MKRKITSAILLFFMLIFVGCEEAAETTSLTQEPAEVVSLDEYLAVEADEAQKSEKAETLEKTEEVNKEDTYLVTRVVDGDTIIVDIGGVEERVRLIGIDTPESVHPDANKNVEYGKIASGFTKEKLEGKEITLEYDVQGRDRYGRILAYVYLDGKMFNKTLLEEGHAKVATYPPNVKYVDDFTALQEQARAKGKEYGPKMLLKINQRHQLEVHQVTARLIISLR